MTFTVFLIKKLGGLLPYLALFILLVTHSFVIASPDAGSLSVEINRKPLKLPKGSEFALPVEQPPRPAMVKDKTTQFTLSGITLRGNTVFTTESLIDVVDESFSKEIDLQGLEKVADQITYHYRRNGYLLARAYVPVQTIRRGIVRISILEGIIDQVKIVNESFLSDKAFSRKDLTTEGKPARADELERGILLLNDLSGVDVSATLTKGQEIGTSDLILDIQPLQRYSAYLEVDNSGNEFTGEERYSGGASISSPLSLGDSLSFRLMGTGEGMTYGRIAWKFPLYGSGWVVGAYHSQLDYSLGGELSASDAKGNSSVFGLELSYPLRRSLRKNIFVNVSYESSDLEDSISANEISKSNDSLYVRISGDTLDGDYVDSWSARLSHGSLSITPDDLDRITARKAGSFQKLNLAYAGIQYMSDSWSIYGSAYGQLASKNLDSSEKFDIGGANGVRAYRQGQALGDQGYLLTAEARYSFESGVELAGFIDHGNVTLNRDPWDALNNTPGYKNTYTLTGMGLGVFWSGLNGFMVKADVAMPIGSKASFFDGGPTPTEEDDIQFWIKLSKSF